MRRAGLLAGLGSALLIGGCGGNAAAPKPGASQTSATVSGSDTSARAATPIPAKGFHLSSPAFSGGGVIPTRYTCRGLDLSPPLSIAGVPAGTRELVLVMRDPDAPGSDFVHWALAGIPPSTRRLPSGGVPGLVTPGRNSFGTLGYRGPCPPAGAVHHFVLTLTALGARSGLRSGFSADAPSSPAVGIAALIGTFRG